jgi:hypothetical protein
MRQVKLLGLALVSVLALGAIVASVASAVKPEFKGFPAHFVAAQVGTGILETKGGRTVECSAGSALGFIDSAKHLLVNKGGIGIIYTGCKSTSFGAGKCQSGATKGEITTLALLGLLGYTHLAPTEVGILFEPAGGINHFASFECETILGAEKLTVRGTVICPISPINMNTTKYHLNCKQSAGLQTPLSFEGLGTVDTLSTKGEGPETFGFEQSGVSALSTITALTAVEISA